MPDLQDLARQLRGAPRIVGKMPDGRPIVDNGDGTYSTERSITEEIGGRVYNMPTMYGGVELPPEQAIERAVKAGMVDTETGEPLPVFASIEEAVRAAKARSLERGRLMSEVLSNAWAPK